MNYPIGIVVAALSILLSVLHLNQSLLNYYDFVGITVVLGGSLSVACVILPWKSRKELAISVRGLVSEKSIDPRSVASEALRIVRGGAGNITLRGLPGDVLRDGVELIELGLKTDEIEAILRERIYQQTEIKQTIANSFRSLAKYPPAFGLLGTVLGLVSLMRAVSNGASSEEVGVRMAVALVATLYGLIFSNILINPAGEAMTATALSEAKTAEISLQGILLASEGASVLVAQEMLNSFLPRDHRLNALSGGDGVSEARRAA